MKQLLLALACAGLLSACAGPSSQYYSLVAPGRETPAPDAAANPPFGDSAAYGLQLDVIEMPAETQRPQLVIRDPARDPAIQVLNGSLWSAPLVDQVQAVLSAEVAARLGVPDLRQLPGTAARPVRRIDVRLGRFDMLWGRAADLSATWTDRMPQGSVPPGSTPRVCQARVRLPAADGVPALVDAQRAALHRLAILIAQEPADRVDVKAAASGIIHMGCT